MVITIVMEATMQTVPKPVPARTTAPGPEWVVELNFAGCRILRWAEKRRHLLGLSPRSFAPRDTELRPAAL